MKELDSLLNDVDQAQLLGYAGDEKQAMLLGQLAELSKKNPAKAAAAVKKISSMQAAGGNNLSPRDQAILRIDGLPKNIREALFDKRLQLVDDTIYIAKAAGGLSSVEMFKSDDDKSHGVSNIAKAQLEKDLHFLITSVRLTSGVNVSVLDTSYGIIPKEIANGDFEFSINGGRQVFPKDTATSRFDTTGKQNVLVGEVILSTPKWVEPSADIDWNLRFSNVLAPLTNIRVELIGVRVIKA